MMLFQSPIVWLMRVRKRKGYGVHSPFAFDLVTNVLYNKEEYYAYTEMDKDLHWWQKWRVRSLRHLAFRLSNYHRPQTMYCEGELPALVLVFQHQHCPLSHVGEGTMLVLKDKDKCRKFWKRIKEDDRVTVTFDLYDVGIAFARKDLCRQHYVVNW